MDGDDRLINALERIKMTIMEVQEKFSEAAEIFNKRKSYGLAHLPNCQQVVEYINYRKQVGQADPDSLTEYDKMIMDGDQVKEYITNVQAKFLYALRVIEEGKIDKAPEDQALKRQFDINQATLDIIEYSDLLGRLYDVLKIPRNKE